MASSEDEQAQTKAILPFLQRADEISKVEPKVAYYCRMYAVDTGIAFKHRGPRFDGVLRALIAKLERDKPDAGLGENDKEYCRNFAEAIFARADKTDRAGRSDKSTCLTFYAASIFIEILRQFGELPEDLVDMQRYAAWKAADIRKALREGRKPMPGNGNAAPDDLLPGVPPHEAAGMAPEVAAHGAPSGEQRSSLDEGPGLGGLDISDQSGAPELQPSPRSRQPFDSSSSAGGAAPPPQPQHGPAGYGAAPSQGWPPPYQPQLGGQPAGPAAPPPDLPSPPSHQPGGGYQAAQQPPSLPPPSYQQQPPPSGASFGAPGGSSNGEGGLPSAPSFTRSVSVASSAEQQPAGHALAPRYAPGSRVLYDAFDEPEPVRGTVAKVDWQDVKWLYTVALPKQIVRVHEHILAPDYREGEAVIFSGPGGASMPATAIATDATYWRPSYRVRLASGKELDVTDDMLTPAQQQQTQQQHPGQQPHMGEATSGFSPSPPPASAPARPQQHQQPPPPPASQPSGSPSACPRFGASPPPTRPGLPAFPMQPPPSVAPKQSPISVDAYQPAPGFSPSLPAVTEAQKFAKYAVSSLGFEDVPTATKYLQDALRLLTQPS